MFCARQLGLWLNYKWYHWIDIYLNRYCPFKLCILFPNTVCLFLFYCNFWLILISTDYLNWCRHHTFSFSCLYVGDCPSPYAVHIFRLWWRLGKTSKIQFTKIYCFRPLLSARIISLPIKNCHSILTPISSCITGYTRLRRLCG